tara:strand:+ start:589 stop:990 length:402 start_codon:yes stop_codon:yes gene_type:complete
MKTILHRQQSGGVSFERVSDTFLSIVTGAGYGGTPDEIAEQSRRFGLPDDDGKAPYSKDFTDRWAYHMANGDMTSEQVYSLVSERAKAYHGYTESLLVNNVDLESYLIATDYDRDLLRFDDLKDNIPYMELDS